MAVGMLRDDLLSVPGVESAQLDGDAIAPTGVRVHLAPGVDAAVGWALRFAEEDESRVASGVGLDLGGED